MGFYRRRYRIEQRFQLSWEKWNACPEVALVYRMDQHLVDVLQVSQHP
ncbi:hypothetical protein PUN71_012455 [Arthrobacter sp. NQ7]|nr:hypothetical protein [Arthrobacter sp. NQ7]MDJ0458017.1 hypothetical protein [Arthrobacter sp. NQ7]